MLGRRRGQLTLADMDRWYEKIAANSWYRRMRSWSNANLSDDAFTEWYSPIGRPSIPPSYMVTLTLIQLRQGWSDREVVDEAYFDDRVKFALGVGRVPEITCDHSTVCKYRKRFFESELGRQMLGYTLGSAADAGVLEDDEDLVDSLPVAGAVPRQGTYVLIYRAIGRVLAEAAEAHCAVPELRRDDYGQRRKPGITWGQEAARRGLLEDLVADGRQLVASLGSGEHPPSLSQAVDLLRLVVEQDITTDGQGRVEIARATARDRVISVTDPDMRHGRKTSSQKYNGYKGHVLVQNVTSDKPRLVTATKATAANVPDGDVVAELVELRRELTGKAPEQVMGDTSYGSMEVRDRVAEVAPETRVEAPVPPVSSAQGRFSKVDFQIDTEAHTVTCPAGHTVDYQPKKDIDGHKRSQQVHFPDDMCANCPLRGSCVKGNKGRTVTVRFDEVRMQAERARQQDPEWQSHYRERSRVEHVNARLAQHGGRRARARGLLRLDWQLAMAAALHNIEELTRVLGSAWRPKGVFRPHCAQMAQ